MFRLALMLLAAGATTLSPVRTGAGAVATSEAGAAGDAAGGAAAEAAPRAGAAAVEIPITAGRTTILRIEPDVGRPLEREPDLLTKVPSLRRALDLDRDQRWAEAAATYQQALGEIGLAARFGSATLMERAAFKVELERRRSRALAQAAAPDRTDEPTRPGLRVPPPSPTVAPLEQGRLLRLKLMAIRSGTGSVPAGLVSATLRALVRSLHGAEPRGPGSAPGGGAALGARAAQRDDDNPEIRLLLCATRAVAGDRTGARLELAHVRLADRTDPARALPVAVCQAALGYRDDALGSLAVAIHRLGPSPRFLPDQTRELESSNDWDVLRTDPRFDRLFR